MHCPQLVPDLGGGGGGGGVGRGADPLLDPWFFYYLYDTYIFASTG